MSDLLLDTHVWLWYAEGLADTLSTDAVTQINQARKERRLHVSVISAWEIGLLLEPHRAFCAAARLDRTRCCFAGAAGAGIDD